MKRIFQFSIFVVIMMTAMISCMEKDNYATATGITLSETNIVTLRVGATAMLTASVEPSGSSQKVVWSSSTPGIATVDGGVITGLLPGTAIITAMTIDGYISASIFVTVVNPISDISFLNDVLNIARGEKITPLVVITPPSTFDRNLRWSIDDPSIASIDPVTGEVTGLSFGTTTITVVSLENEELRAECTVNVMAIAVTGVMIDQAQIVLTMEETAILTATVLPANADNKTVTWQSENPEFVTVDINTGEITAIASGIAIITVTTEDGSYTDQCTLEVKAVPKNLLQNPSFEEGASTATMPAVWQKVPQSWFNEYPPYAGGGHITTTNEAQINRVSGNDNFFVNANGVFFRESLHGDWCGRIQGNVTGGFYQEDVTLEPGAGYKLSLIVGYRCNDNNMAMKEEHVKILSPDGLTTYHSIPIPLNPGEPTMGSGVSQIIEVSVSFTYSGPNTAVRFQIDQRSFGDTNQSPVMLFDNIELYKTD